ncbi:formin-like protein 1, partial [Physella acuta]|uniref:formin-like protein 1 n=1 Tax=Physella acuta TaxID=109671 RepID=UPI0027DDCD3D
FVEDFVRAPNNGLRLLLTLLKNLQALSSNPTATTPRAAPKGTLRMDEYKKNMVDEQDCLLCIKYTLRIRSAVEEILEYNPGLYTVVTCLMSNYSRSRITALEILTLILTGPTSVDKVLDAFTSMRIHFAESTRFKILVNMMYTRGVSHVLFQVSCLRLLNTILNLCRSANMRVFLQYEMEEAGLDLTRLQEVT